MNCHRLTLLTLFVVSDIFRAVTWAEVKPAGVRVKDQTYWVGQRVPFLVELRAAGSFSGAASFSLPEVPRVVMIKVGNPVVSSEDSDGESVFVQTHEFALFSQKSGTIEIPTFEVRFSHRDGFTGPVKDQTAKVPATKLKIKRPPGSDDNEFVVTTSSLKITETWDPKPGPAQQGAVFHRTITQQAEQISGMAFAPPPETVPDGVRIYLNPPEVADNTERGTFSGYRTDKITYAMQEAGTRALPAIKYVWWDPEKEQFGSQTLPSVTFDVAALPAAKTDEAIATPDRVWLCWIAVISILIVLAIWRRRAIVALSKQVWYRWNPPESVAARRLVNACRRNNPVSAEAAWIQWKNTLPPGFKSDPSLLSAVLELQRALFGRRAESTWQGQNLETAFRHHVDQRKSSARSRASSLPKLNP